MTDIRPVEATLIHADKQTHMAKLTVTFHENVNKSKRKRHNQLRIFIEDERINIE